MIARLSITYWLSLPTLTLILPLRPTILKKLTLRSQQLFQTSFQTVLNWMRLPPPNALALPPFRSTPINDFNRTKPLLSLAFPTLFPYEGAEFTIPRQRSVSYKNYVRHLIKHESGRFAQHPRFRFVVFNTIMRHQAAKSAWFYVRRQAGRPDITIEELHG
ncbi:hypothetical protein N7516_002893 [Penicillium verrucosum]|uniref:uncharacterized protein n=1 Tax=Penicillium verrucosum TaxID=60171 RepID=UPI002545A501|nr:uncharacterized protein N7516_002893 [Penicillium verrucosum]KAJ5942725.1 hypothetical protein N7516_002893 [Penicillium verrucosum]